MWISKRKALPEAWRATRAAILLVPRGRSWSHSTSVGNLGVLYSDEGWDGWDLQDCKWCQEWGVLRAALGQLLGQAHAQVYPAVGMSALRVSLNVSWVGRAGGAPAFLSMALSVPAAGWLLDLQHLTLGAQIGEGEFGGEEGTQQAVFRTDLSTGQRRAGVGCLGSSHTLTSQDPLPRKPSLCALFWGSGQRTVDCTHVSVAPAGNYANMGSTCGLFHGTEIWILNNETAVEFA